LGVITLFVSVVVFFKNKISNYFQSHEDENYGSNNTVDKKKHLWGYVDTDFIRKNNDEVCLTGDHYQISGKPIMKLIKFMLSILKINRNDINIRTTSNYLNDIYTKIEELKKNSDLTNILKNIFEDQLRLSELISYDGKDILYASHGQTNYEIINFYYRQPTHEYLARSNESDIEELVNFVKLNNDTNKYYQIKLIPRGGGTNVTRCLVVQRAANCDDIIELFISVDMLNHKGMISIDTDNNLATFRAGTTGKDLEIELSKHGFMCGHEPDSVEFSTLGGWISTNASGMKRGRYGNIEDIVTKMDIICPLYGIVRNIGHNLRTSNGPDISKSLFGLEGSCLIILNATIKIKKLPEKKMYDSYVVPNWEIGTRFLKEVKETGSLPASLRMVDNLQFQFGQALKPVKGNIKELISKLQKRFLKLLGYDLEKICAMTIVYEGSSDECKSIKKRLDKIAKKYGSMSGGSENGRAGYNLTNAIAYIRDFANTMHVFGDTFETSVPWNRVSDAGDIIVQALKDTHTRLKKGREDILRGEIFVSYRITQLYETGVCMYFTYAYYCYQFEDIEYVQKEIESTLKDSVGKCNASLSHHHGIGKLKNTYHYKSQNPHLIQMTSGLKDLLDPNNIICSRNNCFDEI
jgi:alkyldihydroxyacetonephosphate synthase